MEHLPEAKPRRPWLAGLLAALCPGLGHLYVGVPALAIAVPLVSILVPLGAMVVGAYSLELLFPLVLASIVGYALFWLGQVTSAVWLAHRQAQGYRLRPYNGALPYFLFFVATTFSGNFLTQLFRERVVEPFKVPSRSMLPLLAPGDHFLTVKAGPYAALERGAVIVFTTREESAETMHVKRVVALEGDTASVEAGQLRVNGQLYPHRPCEEPNFRDDGFEARCMIESPPTGEPYRVLLGTRSGDAPPFTVPEGHVFVLGDNRDHSVDSRQRGPVPKKDLLGRARVLWFSSAWARIGQRL